MFIEIDAGSLVSLADAWEASPQVVVEELTAATLESEMLLEREVKDFLSATDHKGVTGALQGSVQSSVPELLGDTVIGVVGSPLSYAEPVELGTRPHPVSAAGVQALEDWVCYKLGIQPEEAERVAHAVAWKIRMRGTPGKHMFAKTLEAQKGQLSRIYSSAAERITHRLAGAA